MFMNAYDDHEWRFQYICSERALVFANVMNVKYGLVTLYDLCKYMMVTVVAIVYCVLWVWRTRAYDLIQDAKSEHI